MSKIRRMAAALRAKRYKMSPKDKKGKKTSNRDEKGRFVKQVDGASTLPGKPFRTTDERARKAGQLSGASRREKGDLRKMCQLWMEEEIATGKNGEKITGAQAMVRRAVKEMMEKGNMKAWELLRDTAGFKPVDRVMVADVEPAVIDEVERLVQEAGE